MPSLLSASICSTLIHSKGSWTDFTFTKANAANHAGDPDFNADAVSASAQSDETHAQTKRQEDDLAAIIAANQANHAGDADVADEATTLQAASDATHAGS